MQLEADLEPETLSLGGRESACGGEGKEGEVKAMRNEKRQWEEEREEKGKRGTEVPWGKAHGGRRWDCKVSLPGQDRRVQL